MCGRYAVTLPPEAVRAFFSYVEQPNFPPRYNIAPTQPIAVVRRDAASADPVSRRFQLVRWGFVPGFVKDFKSFRPFVNARAEDLAERASFRHAFRRRRCLVIADGFYEWRRQANGPAEPFMVRRSDGAPFGMAGLVEHWTGADGSEIDTACIITTAARGSLATIHHRMPVVIPTTAFELWLDIDERQAGAAARLLDAAPLEPFDIVQIGPAVNKATNDEASVQEPVGAPLRDGGGWDTEKQGPRESQGSLF